MSLYVLIKIIRTYKNMDMELHHINQLLKKNYHYFFLFPKMTSIDNVNTESVDTKSAQ